MSTQKNNKRGVPNTEEIQKKYNDNIEVLIGTLLGDASLQTYTDGKTWRLRYLQKDEKYLRHLYGIWVDFTGAGPQYIEDKERNGRGYFNTKVYKGFTEIAHKFYSKNEKGVGIKRVPADLELTPRVLAYWYMDDGSKKSNAKGNYLCTDSFLESELDILREKIKKNGGIEVNYHKTEKNRLRIYIPSKYHLEFENLIKGHIVESMKYKLHSELSENSKK